jgi:hypothetical protein
VDLLQADRRLHDLLVTLPDDDRAVLIDALLADPANRAEAIEDLQTSGLGPEVVRLVIEAEEDLTVLALLVGTLAEPDP